MSRRASSKVLPRVLDLCALAGGVVLCLGWAVRLTVRDGVPLASTVFYATPLPVLAALGAVLCLAAGLRRRRIVAGAAALVALGGLVSLLASLSLNPAPAPAASDLKVVFWNARRPVQTLPDVLAVLRAQDADILGIDETGEITGQAYKVWQGAFPDYRLARKRSSGMLILTKGELLTTEKGPLGDYGEYLQSEIRLGDRQLRVLLVDMPASPWRSRRAYFARVQELIDAGVGKNLILMGDFNTPLDSVHFDPLRTRLAHAFEAAGRGFFATWPVPVPVLGLDHVWIDRTLEVTGCSLGFSRLSDHRLITATLRLRGTGPERRRDRAASR